MSLKTELEVRLTSLDKSIEMEKQRHESLMDKYSRHRATVVAMIELEDAELSSQEDIFGSRKVPIREATAAELEKEILALLKTQSNGAHAVLRDLLVRRGLGKESDPQFGRRVHGTLMSLRHRGAVEQASPGHWRIVSRTEEDA